MAKKKRFDFKIQGGSNYSFEVVKFIGEEAISSYYWLEIDLVSLKKDVNIASLLEAPATFTIFRKDNNRKFYGVIDRFVQLREYNQYAYFRATLVPKLRWLGYYLCSQIFLDKTPEEFLTDILKQAGLTNSDYDFKLIKSSPANSEYLPQTKHDYICQYNETHLNFFHRWLESLGMYYFFEQDDSTKAEKLIITDTNTIHIKIPELSQIPYSQEGTLSGDVVTTFFCSQAKIPTSLHLRNYYYDSNNIDKPIDVENPVDNVDGLGEIYSYGENFTSQRQANYLATIQKERIKCRERIFTGQSNCSCLRAGYLMELDQHYRNDFNDSYLITRIYHEGSQTSYLSSGLSIEITDQEKKNYYQNEFQAIEGSVQLRAECQTQKPKIYGMLNGKIDAEGSGEYAELDGEGRYKVVLPFDVNKTDTNDYFDIENNRAKGKRSAWIRMMQPYGGPGRNTHSVGMHFPLRKGTEVLLSFIEGDIDRPVIAGVVPNKNCPSVVKEENERLLQLISSGGNTLVFRDDENKEAILLSSPKNNSFILLGDSSSADDFWFFETNPSLQTNLSPGASVNMAAEASINITASSELDLTSASAKVNIKSPVGGFTILSAKATGTFLGISADFFLGEKLSVFAGLLQDLALSEVISIGIGAKQEVNIGYVTNLKTGETESCGFKTACTGTKTALHALKDDISGIVQKLRGQTSNTSGNTTSMSGNNTTTSGNNTNMSGSATNMAGNATNMAGNSTVLSSIRNKLHSASNMLGSAKNSIVGGVNNMINSLTNML